MRIIITYCTHAPIIAFFIYLKEAKIFTYTNGVSRHCLMQQHIILYVTLAMFSACFC